MTELPRGTCPDCGNKYRLRIDGTMGAHRRLASDGYSRIGYCDGIGKKPEEAEDGWQTEQGDEEG